MECSFFYLNNFNTFEQTWVLKYVVDTILYNNVNICMNSISQFHTVYTSKALQFPYYNARIFFLYYKSGYLHFFVFNIHYSHLCMYTVHITRERMWRSFWYKRLNDNLDALHLERNVLTKRKRKWYIWIHLSEMMCLVWSKRGGLVMNITARR